MRNFLINLLFKLLGNTYHKQFAIMRLFGNDTASHDSRKKKWERALARVWQDKDLLDFFYYQAESDKERAWAGKIDKKLSQGARIRTLFFVYQAHRAYLESTKTKGANPDSVAHVNREIKSVAEDYKNLTNV